METLINIANLFFDQVFARNEQASVWLAMGYTFVAFSGIYLFLVVPSYFLFRYRDHFNDKPLREHQLQKELSGSLISIIMFSLLAAPSFYLIKNSWMSVAGDIGFRQWLWECLVLYLWNELHFYAGHRLLHTNWLYRHIHIEHHRSITVTPLASWRFHWLEALILGSVLPLALLFYSFSAWSLMMLPLISIFWNIVGHSNHKTNLPLLGKASERHAIHHSRFNGNYGFSVKWLDRLFGSEIKET